MKNKFQIPWEDRPAGSHDVMWRYSKNPIIGRYQIPSSNSIFNSAVVPFEDGFAGVFRCDNKVVQMNIFAGFSKDGINWEIDHEPIRFKAGKGGKRHFQGRTGKRTGRLCRRQGAGGRAAILHPPNAHRHQHLRSRFGLHPHYRTD